MDIFIDQHRTGGGYPGGDPFAADVIFLMLGEGPTDGTQVNPTTGTLTKDEVSGILQGLGNTPFDIGSTVSASTSGMPFGSSWIRFPGGVSSNNFIGIGGVPYLHPRTAPLCIDGWFQLDSLSDTVCLAGDDSAFGGGHWNWTLIAGTSGVVQFQVRTGAVLSGAVSSVTTGSITPGVPFHVEAWGDGAGTIGLAFNGVQAATVSCPASTIDTSAGSLLIGAQNHYVAFPTFTRVLTGYMKCARGTAAVRHTVDFTPPSSLDEYAL